MFHIFRMYLKRIPAVIEISCITFPRNNYSRKVRVRRIIKYVNGFKINFIHLVIILERMSRYLSLIQMLHRMENGRFSVERSRVRIPVA